MATPTDIFPNIDIPVVSVIWSYQGLPTNEMEKRVTPGINPPWILSFGASTVPIIQLSLSSKTLNEAALYDYGIFRVRQQLSTVPGTLLPAPYGGKARQIMVDLDQDALLGKS